MSNYFVGNTMASSTFDWFELKENLPEEQYTIVQIALSKLDQKEQMEFMNTSEFVEWFSSKEIEEFVNSPKRWQQDRDK